MSKPQAVVRFADTVREVPELEPTGDRVEDLRAVLALAARAFGAARSPAGRRSEAAFALQIVINFLVSHDELHSHVEPLERLSEALFDVARGTPSPLLEPKKLRKRSPWSVVERRVQSLAVLAYRLYCGAGYGDEASRARVCETFNERNVQVGRDTRKRPVNKHTLRDWLKEAGARRDLYGALIARDINRVIGGSNLTKERADRLVRQLAEIAAREVGPKD